MTEVGRQPWIVANVLRVRDAVSLAPNLRVGYFSQLTRYLDGRTATGHLRAMPDAAAATRVVSETISWFAWHRHEGRDARLYDDDAARETVIAFVCAALVPEASV